MKINIFILVIFSCQFCLAESNDTKAIESIKSYIATLDNPKPIIKGMARGDFNGDGAEDLVVLLEHEDYEELNGHVVEPYIYLVAFLGSANGNFSFYKSTGDTFPHPKVNQEVKISRESIFLTRHVAGSARPYSDESFQFKIYKGSLVLIGIEYSNFDRDGICCFETDGGSINLLTSQKKTWIMKNEKKVWGAESAVSNLKPIEFEKFVYGEIHLF